MKYVFITGGVVSSLGKGLTAGALGALLEARGLKVNLQKFDPYLNVDPGTMSPFQHGEVYVLDDGAETDLDLGHYERFSNTHLSGRNSLSSGQIYETVIQKERRGDYLGKTVQVIPHVTDEIKKRIYCKDEAVDVSITEIGGTIGDIEGLPFLEAMRQFALEVGHQDVLFIHVTLLPYLKAAGELKTKPSQQSVAKLREIGIQPDILICRTEERITEAMRQKLSLFCSVPTEAVIEERDVDISIYELPLNLHKEKLDALVVSRLGLKTKNPVIDAWAKVVKNLKEPSGEVSIGIVGKYIELQDAYKSVYEALTHGGISNNYKIKRVPIDAEDIERASADKFLKGLDGLVIPGGFGNRGTEGKIDAARYAREKKIPYFGLCLGMHIAVIEFARNVLGLKDANSTELALKCANPVIALMEEQKTVTQKGASMRLGAYACALSKGSLVAKAYGEKNVHERHRHRYEFNNEYRNQLEAKGLKAVGVFEEKGLVEIVELQGHPWFVGVQFHPEFQSKPHHPHPLFSAFIKAAIKHRKTQE